MNESIKLQQDELQTLSNIQNRYQEIIIKFGQLYIDKLELDLKIKQLSDAENQTRDLYTQTQVEEKSWIDKIAEKYGDGNLSIKDGTFTPNTPNK